MPAPDPDCRAALERCSGAIEDVGRRLEIAASRAPSPAERAALELRRDALGAALAPGAADEAKRLVAWLFSLIPAREQEAEDLEKLLEGYAYVLRREPSWAVKAACLAWIDAGERFRPGAPELLARARAAAQPFHAERGRVERLLAAEVYPDPTPEQRERVKALFAQLRAKLA